MLRLPFVDIRVTFASGSNKAELSRRSRFLAALVGVGLLAALVLASQLQPDPRGWGTHEQLGLPPCTFLTLVGKRCPACGMTTAWGNVMHGRPLDALAANVGGTVLAVVALVVAAVVVGHRGARQTAGVAAGRNDRRRDRGGTERTRAGRVDAAIVERLKRRQSATRRRQINSIRRSAVVNPIQHGCCEDARWIACASSPLVCCWHSWRRWPA